MADKVTKYDINGNSYQVSPDAKYSLGGQKLYSKSEFTKTSKQASAGRSTKRGATSVVAKRNRGK